MMDAPVAEAVIGHNQATPFDLSQEEIDGLYEEAKNWLDGVGIKTQAEADGVSHILDALRSAHKVADANRKKEKAPHDSAAKAVQEKWQPLLGRVELASQVCKDALKPYLEKVEAQKREAAESARRIADAKMLAAQEAVRAASAADLAQREQAEVQLRDAKAADKFASRAEKDKAAARGGAKAVTLRTTYRPVLTDAVLAARHFWGVRRSECETFFLSLAEADVRAGKREIPGFEIVEEKSAV
jgi:hypothetical protein